MTPRGERGSAVPFAIACIGLVLLLGAALGVVTAMVHAHRSAQSAADLAALAVADAVGSGSDPCAVGAAVAAANEARLVTCAVDGREARVTVQVEGPHWLGQVADLAAEARAGPA
ncbi:Rv3654c family TadE-like protein [Nocardioides sp. CN2-186]|uniref:Rv3654c family TadE-like protein n=1 Tax=Nocardioides tweenelious TaxID=3156607 RepID=UPI0032B43CE8